MAQEKILSSNTAKENKVVKFNDNPLSVKLTSESNLMLEDIVNYLQINKSNAIRMAISKLHKEIF